MTSLNLSYWGISSQPACQADSLWVGPADHGQGHSPVYFAEIRPVVHVIIHGGMCTCDVGAIFVMTTAF